MTQTQITNKLNSMKKTRNILKLVTLIAALVSMAVIVAYNFMPVARLVSPTGTDYEQGFDFPGWQLTYYGFGRQFIMQDHLFDPNPWTIVGVLGSLIVLIVGTVRYNKGRNKEKAIREFVMGGFLIYSALTLGLLIIPAATTAATAGGVYDFLNQYLLNPASSFTQLPYTYVTFAALLLAAVVKIGNGCFLLYQKAFAAKYTPQETERRK